MAARAVLGSLLEDSEHHDAPHIAADQPYEWKQHSQPDNIFNFGAKLSEQPMRKHGRSSARGRRETWELCCGAAGLAYALADVRFTSHGPDNTPAHLPKCVGDKVQFHLEDHLQNEVALSFIGAYVWEHFIHSQRDEFTQQAKSVENGNIHWGSGGKSVS